MSSAIGSGDWVECIRKENPQSPFVLGGVYLCTGIHENLNCACGRPAHAGLIIAGRPSRARLGGWCGFSFRPIYRPKANLIESLLTPADAPVEHERADA